MRNHITLVLKLLWINLQLNFAFKFMALDNVHRNCGVRPLELTSQTGRIVGGRDAFYGEVPWQALIKEEKFFGIWKHNKCGGVLIHHKWVLTAAHCNSGLFGSLRVILGEYNLREWNERDDSSPVIRKVLKTVVHPEFDHRTLDNDLALIELDISVEYEPRIQPICIPDYNFNFNDTEGYVSGWGITSYENRDVPELLQIVKVPILSNSMCEDMFYSARHRVIIKDTMLCAGFAIGGKDSCEGDSGGPLMVRIGGENGYWVLAGIVSNGIRCAEPNLPGIYMRISQYKDWILQTISVE